MEPDLNRRQLLTLLGIGGLLAGLLLVPPVLQELYGVSAIKVAFVIIVIYAVINWRMKKA